MLNMNSPVVQNLMQSQSGFNPYQTNNGYIPQQQFTYQNYSGYNPYIANKTQKDELDDWTYSYDPMPAVVVNEARGINSNRGNIHNGTINPFMNTYNPQMFNGYMNPILMRNQMEAERLKQREEAIAQGRVWRTLFKNAQAEDSDFDIDYMVQKVESLYYQEPINQDIPIKEKIIIDKNNHIAEIESRMDYYRENNIPIYDNRAIQFANLCNYYNRISQLAGDDCDMVDYFTRVYPELKYEQLSFEAERFNKNLKNRYNSKEFNQLLDKVTEGRTDSYYSKLMESFADDGVRFTNNDGLVITPDEMEIKLPDRLLKERQSKYYEQRKKFYDSIFNKKE